MGLNSNGNGRHLEVKDVPKVIQRGSAAAIALEKRGAFSGIFSANNEPLGSFDNAPDGTPVTPIYENLWEQDAQQTDEAKRTKAILDARP